MVKFTNRYIRNIIKEEIRRIIKEEVEAIALVGAAPEQHGVTKDPDGYEGRMAKQNLTKMVEYASSLIPLIQDDENLEPWVQEKIAVAASMMDSVGHYLQYEKKH